MIRLKADADELVGRYQGLQDSVSKDRPSREPSGALVSPLERWNRLAFVLVQSVAHHASISQVNFPMWPFLERQGVLHPVCVISIGEILTCMRTARFLSVGR